MSEDQRYLIPFILNEARRLSGCAKLDELAQKWSIDEMACRLIYTSHPSMMSYRFLGCRVASARCRKYLGRYVSWTLDRAPMRFDKNKFLLHHRSLF